MTAAATLAAVASTLPTAPAAAAPAPVVVDDVDGGLAAVALTSAGTPVVAYHATVSGEIRVATCTDTACATGPTTSTVATADPGLGRVALALDDAGHPIVSYTATAGSARNATLAVCADPGCAGPATLVTIDPATTTVSATDLALDGAGYPVVAYAAGDGAGSSLRLAVCSDPDCTSAPSITTLDSAGPGETLSEPSLRLDSTGRPVVAYAHTDTTGSTTRVVTCDDAVCTTTAVVTVADGFSWAESLELTADDRPVIRWVDGDNPAVAVCSDRVCAAPVTRSTVVDLTGEVVPGASAPGAIDLDATGNPIVSYYVYDAASNHVDVAYCHDPTCAATPTVTRLDRGLDGVAKVSSVLDADGDLVAAYSAVVGSQWVVRLVAPGPPPDALWSWGRNFNGQLGLGDTLDRTSPIQAGIGTDWAAIAAGGGHSLGVAADGSLWATGDNFYGQVGDGTTTDRSGPVRIGTDTDWVTVAAGAFQSFGIRSDGTLWAWGRNSSGQLGDGTTADRSSPVRIGTGTDWATIAAGGGHALAVRTDGTLWAWGNNNTGEVGDGTTTNRSSPVRIGTDTDWATVAAGGGHSLGIRTDGTLWVWGANYQGQLGDGTTTHRLSPVPIGTDTDWATVAAGASHSFGIRTDGTLWAWGRNNAGQLGDGTQTDRSSPVPIGTATDWDDVAAGAYHSLARRSNGTRWAWGDNGYGQLGDGTTTDQLSPAQIGTDTGWSTIRAGSWHSLAIRGAPQADTTPPVLTLPPDIVEDGTDPAGNTVVFSPAPSALDDVDGPVPVTCDPPSGSLFPNGFTTVTCTASDRAGNTATATFSVTVRAANLRVQIPTPAGQVPLGDEFPHTIVVTNDGPSPAATVTLDETIEADVAGTPVAATVVAATPSQGTCTVGPGSVACDLGTIGQGGQVSVVVDVAADTEGLVRADATVATTTPDFDPADDTTSYSTTVVVIPPGPCARGDGPEPYAFGRNDYYDLGQGVRFDHSGIPLPVARLAGVVDLDAGHRFTLARLDDGTVCGWGTSWLDSLPTVANPRRPSEIPELHGASMFDLAHGHGLAVVDGDAYGWGSNYGGKAGEGGDTIPVPTPITTADGTDPTFVAVAAGFENSLLLTDDGRLYSMGRNLVGELGLGYTGPTPTPGRAEAITALDDVVAMGIGTRRAVAATSTGDIYEWGVVPNGPISTPRYLATLPTPIQSIEVSTFNRSLVGVLDGNGDLWTWGTRFLGPSTATPTKVPLNDVVSFSLDENHVLAITDDGRVWGWGVASRGVLTDLVTPDGGGQVSVPVDLGFSDATLVATAPQVHSVVLGSYTGAPLRTVEWASGNVRTGIASTDGEGDGADFGDPIETTVIIPDSIAQATVRINDMPLDATQQPAPYVMLGWQAVIHVESTETPPPEDPYLARFDLQLPLEVLPPVGTTADALAWTQALTLFRDGVPVPDCAEAAPPYSDDPCIFDRRVEGDDAVVEIAATAFSTWTFGLARPVAAAGGPYTVAEGATVGLDATGSTGPAPLSVFWDTPATLNDPTSPTPQATWIDDGVLPVRLEVTDALGATGDDSTTLTVTNADPVITEVDLPTGAVSVGQSAAVTVSFTDAGIADTHSVAIDWGDGTIEPLTVTSSAGAGNATGTHIYATPGSYPVTATVVDDDGGTTTSTPQTMVIVPITIQPGTRTAAELDTGDPRVINVPVRLNYASSQTVTVDWATDDSPAQPQAGVDYDSASGTLTFNPGQTLRYIPITVYPDEITEGEPIASYFAETVTIDLSNPVGGELGTDTTAELEIRDDDKAVIRPFGVSTFEDDTTVSVPVYLNEQLQAAEAPITVEWETFAGTTDPGIAREGEDFVAASGTLTFQPGEVLQTVEIDILEDTIDEPALLYGEWALIRFYDASGNAQIDPSFFGLGLIIIFDDDP